MPRIRSVHPDLCTSETMAKLSAYVERTFVRLWTHCDDQGRCVDNLRLIKAAIYPLHDEVTVDRLDEELDVLADAGLIVRYEVDEKRYLAVASWTEFQHPQHPAKARIPAPPNDPFVPDTRALRESSCSPRVDVSLGVGVGVGVGEGVGGESEGRARGTRRTRIPDDWQPNERHAAFANEHRLDLAHEVPQFRDHHGAKGSVMKDWDKAFWTWLRNAKKWSRTSERPADWFA